MIISRTQVQNLLKDFTKDEKTAKSDIKKVKINNSDSDNAKVNEIGEAYQIAKKVINNVPEVREDRLANVQQALKTGTYSVSDEEIAEKMIARSLVDKLV